PPSPTPTPFPYTTLFRSAAPQQRRRPDARRKERADGSRRESFSRPQTRADDRRESAFPGDAAGVVSEIPYELLMKIQQGTMAYRSEEHTSELQSQSNLVC